MRAFLLVPTVLAGVVAPSSPAVGAGPSPPGGGSGGIGIRLVDAPDSQAGAVARSYVVDRMAPGAILHRRIEVGNSTGLPVAVAVYPAGAHLVRGSFEFAPGQSRNELSSWTSVSRGLLALPAGSTAAETVTIAVPKEASPGERYAVIWAEVSAPAATAGRVRLVNRVGIRMYISIGPGGAAPPNFTIDSIAAKRLASGEPLLVAKVHNSGSRTLDVSGTLTLSHGPAGLRAGPFPVTLGSTLAPDHSEPMTAKLDRHIPRGPWLAHIKLTSSGVRQTATATITFPRVAATGKAPPTKIAAPSSRHLTVVVTLLVSLALVPLAFLLSRRRRL